MYYYKWRERESRDNQPGDFEAFCEVSGGRHVDLVQGDRIAEEVITIDQSCRRLAYDGVQSVQPLAMKANYPPNKKQHPTPYLRPPHLPN